MNIVGIPLAKKLSENAKIPTRGSQHAAGFDLYSAENLSINPGCRSVVKTNISLEIPEGYYGRIAPRSGLSVKNGVLIGGGVIDSDFRGDVGAILFNLGSEVFNVKVGDRIAQIVFEKHYFSQLWEADELQESNRGENGWGSTGK